MAVAIAWLPGPAGTRRRVAKPSVEEPDAAEPARPDLWGARVSNDPGLPDRHAAPGAPAGHLQPRVTPESMGLIGAHHMAFPSKENPNPPISVTRVLGRQTMHRGQRRGIPHGQSRLVAQRRPCHREHGARAAV